VISWNAIIGGYAQHGYGEEAFNLYRQMKGEGVKPNKITFVSILNACANLAALVEGMEFHREICEAGLEADVCVGNALIDMYTKSGNIEGACRVFDQMPARDVVSWNAMIGGYAQHGYGNKALEVFKQMKTEGFEPDRITFVNVLSACNHAGLVDEGHQHFSSMDRDYKIMPTLDHYCCMVDLLGRTGFLQEAEDFIQRMPFEPDASIWSPLLGACHRYGKVKVVEHVADWTLKLDSQDAAVYVLLSNMYAAAGMWENVEKVRYLMKDRGVKKGAG
jgi:pentatricopeptide repeat protein